MNTLTTQRDALKADLTLAGEHLAQVTAAAAPALARREYLRTAVHVSNPGHATAEERQLIDAHTEAEARVLALEDALRDVERELGKLEANEAALKAGTVAEKKIAAAEAKVKFTQAHQAKVRQLQQLKLSEIQRAIRAQQTADTEKARAAVAALLGKEVPQVSTEAESAAVRDLELLLAQVDIELRAAEAEAEAAQQALNDLTFPVQHAQFLRSHQAFVAAIEAAMPHLDAHMRARSAMGWGFYLPDEADLNTSLRRYRETHAPA